MARSSRARFSVRGLLAATAAAGLLAGGAALRQRSAAYRREALRCGARAEDAIRSCVIHDRSLPQEESHRKYLRERAFFRRLFRYYRDRQAKYERAARYPWLTIEPAPPKPK